MTTATDRPVFLHRTSRETGPATPPRWSVAAIEALFALPFPDLIHRAQTVHRENFDPRQAPAP